ncbi:MAG: hypothetical protein A2V46_05445 [Bacteroidetes bacterium RBG_19FT_COMBO_42_7]|nr:MAG: hypothetical protein A2V46_05445 [Bacteroidetes bacterium RBG_19FT_COMBO_42_7]
MSNFKLRIPAKLLILLHSFLLIPVFLFSQEEDFRQRTHYFGFEPGSNQIKENILIPKVNRGSVIEFSYRFENEGRNYNEVTFNIGYSKLRTKVETEKVTQNLQMSVGYSWGKNLLPGEKVNYYLGVKANYLWTLMEFPVWDESRAYWGTVISAGPFNRVNLAFDNNTSWICSLQIDLIGFCSRPDEERLYAQEKWTVPNIIQITNSGFSFVTLNSFVICSLRNEYRIPLKNDNFFSFCNSITYATVSESKGKSLQTVKISFGFGLGF